VKTNLIQQAYIYQEKKMSAEEKKWLEEQYFTKQIIKKEN
jgi:hypothetical protein